MVDTDRKHALDMHINNGDNQNWLYNQRMDKVFIKLNSVMTATVTYKPLETGDLFLRAMIVYTNPDDMHLPVTRCANHRAITSRSLTGNES